MLLCATFTMLFAVQYRLGTIPENAQLTWREFLAEKLDIRTGRARAADMTEAIGLLESGHAAQACELTATAATRWGDSMMLLYAALQSAESIPEGPSREACVTSNATRRALLTPTLMY